MSKAEQQTPNIRNRKASHRFEIIDRMEAGISLTGSEVKSLREGHASLDEAWAAIRDGELFLRDCNIQPYRNAGYSQHVPTRERRLLMHRREIRRLHNQVTQKGLTLIPLEMRFNERGRVKVQIGLCRGKKTHDKRTDLRKREDMRDAQRAMKRARQG